MKKVLRLLLFVISLIVTPSLVFAIATGTGNLSLSAGITYDSDSLQWYSGPSSLETWTLGQIVSFPNPDGIDFHYADMQAIYDYSPIAGWGVEPLPLYGTYNANTISIVNDHSNALNPSASSSVAFSSNAFSDVSSAYTYTNTMYFASLRATGNGSFTFYVDYEGSWSGTTSTLNDWLDIGGDLQVNVNKINYDSNGKFLDWGEIIASEKAREVLTLKDVDAKIIDNFSGRLTLTVDYNTDDYFYVRFDGVNRIDGFSADQNTAPVPEPGTLLLLGSGLAGLALYRRRMNKA